MKHQRTAGQYGPAAYTGHAKVAAPDTFDFDHTIFVIHVLVARLSGPVILYRNHDHKETIQKFPSLMMWF